MLRSLFSKTDLIDPEIQPGYWYSFLDVSNALLKTRTITIGHYSYSEDESYGSS